MSKSKMENEATSFLDLYRTNLLLAIFLWTAVELLIMLGMYSLTGTIWFFAPFLILLSFSFGVLLADIAKTLKALLVSQTLDFTLFSVIIAITVLIPRFSKSLTWLDVSVVLGGFTLLVALAYFFWGILGSIAGAWVGSWREGRKNARKIAPLEPVSGLAGLPLKSVSAEQSNSDRTLEEISKEKNRYKNE